MPDSLARLIVAVLLLVHGFLVAWAVVGLAEFFLPATPWPAISNPLFPDAILLLQWLFVLAAATVFIVGYAVRWPPLPAAITVGYAAMAGLCAVETFGYLEHPTRFLAMALEYLAYVAILAFLYRSGHVRRRLGRAPLTPSWRSRRAAS